MVALVSQISNRKVNFLLGSRSKQQVFVLLGSGKDGSDDLFGARFVGRSPSSTEGRREKKIEVRCDEGE